jgi:hypothetical protein
MGNAMSNIIELCKEKMAHTERPFAIVSIERTRMVTAANRPRGSPPIAADQ